MTVGDQPNTHGVSQRLTDGPARTPLKEENHHGSSYQPEHRRPERLPEPVGHRQPDVEVAGEAVQSVSASTGPPTTRPVSPSARACAARSVASRSPSATRRTASASCRPLKVRSNEVHSILQRMRDLAVQAVTTRNDAAAAANIRPRSTSLNAELDRIGSTTAFGTKLLDGSRRHREADVPGRRERRRRQHDRGRPERGRHRDSIGHAATTGQQRARPSPSRTPVRRCAGGVSTGLHRHRWRHGVDRSTCHASPPRPATDRCQQLATELNDDAGFAASFKATSLSPTPPALPTGLSVKALSNGVVGVTNPEHRLHRRPRSAPAPRRAPWPLGPTPRHRPPRSPRSTPRSTTSPPPGHARCSPEPVRAHHQQPQRRRSRTCRRRRAGSGTPTWRRKWCPTPGRRS